MCLLLVDRARRARRVGKRHETVFMIKVTHYTQITRVMW